MDQMDGSICIQDKTAFFFKVPVFAARLLEIYRRRRCGDERELWNWIDEGLALALGIKEPAEQQLALSLSHMREVELFCAIAAHAPETFFGPWYWLWEHVGSDPAYWIFPDYSDADEPDGQYIESYLDKDALVDDWADLLATAENRAKVQQR